MNLKKAAPGDFRDLIGKLHLIEFLITLPIGQPLLVIFWLNGINNNFLVSIHHFTLICSWIGDGNQADIYRNKIAIK
ncbi:hypothetical protein RC91_07825 [Pectobacterium brasiliense]|nr:hypothetical protein RC91_07825 [Pectobacterium brasiliense]